MLPPEIQESISRQTNIASASTKLQEDSGIWGGFKQRAADAGDHPGESLTRAAVSLAVGGCVAVATRGSGIKYGMALGAGAAATMQAGWSLATGGTDSISSTKERIGAAAFDALALGALPGAVGAGGTRKMLDNFGLIDDTKPLTTMATEAKAATPFAAKTSELSAVVPKETAMLADDAARANLAPLNAWSRSAEPIGQEISNFARTPFTLDGKRYESVEGFYSSLLYRDPARRAEIAQMWGLEAKKVGNGSNLRVTTYGKETIKLGSEEHHRLVERAIQAKFEQNPALTKAFMETHPRPIIHDVGHPDKPGTDFPREVLERILTQIREDYVTGKKLLGH